MARVKKKKVSALIDYDAWLMLKELKEEWELTSLSAVVRKLNKYKKMEERLENGLN